MVASGELVCIVSTSTGKDSTATALAMKEAGIAFRMVYGDTAWEAPETYAHLEVLREKLGPIDVVGFPGGMPEKVRRRAGFPTRLARWCTQELKVDALRAFHDSVEKETGRETACVVGVRAQESKARSGLPVWEDDAKWGGWIWRPILHWSVEDVLAIHHRHGIPVHPLYQRGHDRVGCFPCIFASKEEIRLIAERAPWRIDEIRELEREVTAERAKRNADHLAAAIAAGTYVEPYTETVVNPDDPDDVEVVQKGYQPRYSHPIGTFFQSIDRDVVMPIDDVVTWSRTVRGGRQLPVFPPDPTGGCFRWGMCEAPSREVDE
jgi:3'-phosphoadenosine 5'-phosphosulfate sulfotransferase (PAPS reductase)/FAD synthetase